MEDWLESAHGCHSFLSKLICGLMCRNASTVRLMYQLVHDFADSHCQVWNKLWPEAAVNLVVERNNTTGAGDEVWSVEDAATMQEVAVLRGEQLIICAASDYLCF